MSKERGWEAFKAQREYLRISPSEAFTLQDAVYFGYTARDNETCVWKTDEDGNYIAECGERNAVPGNYCSGCGRKIVEES